MKKLDMGYKNLAPMTFSFDEAQEIAREVWDAYGATAFIAPSGNMIAELVNLSAAKAIASVKGINPVVKESFTTESIASVKEKQNAAD